MSSTAFSTLRASAFSLAFLLCVETGLSQIQVKTALRPDGKWVSRETRRLEDSLPNPAQDSGLDSFGGVPSTLTRPNGYFQTQKILDRWWLVTPKGGLFISRGVNSVNQLTSSGAKSALKEKFRNKDAWYSETQKLLEINGFNTLGAWSNLKDSHSNKARTPLISFMSKYGKIRGGTYQKPGHTGYPKDCPFIFDPGFERFCNAHAESLADDRSDPTVLGYFSDNELPWSLDMLENYLSLPSTDPGHQAAKQWLENRKKTATHAAPIDSADRTEFLAFALDRYLGITGAALRKHAPNHLFLGPRLHGSAIKQAVVFQTLGKHVDVVSVNYYHAWSPSPTLLEMWNRESGKPIMITEFYAKAGDAGLSNHGGAGWIVENQKDRGLFYQNFTIGLLASHVCVGWHWHRYADNDPADKRADPSNRDSNKGIVSNRYQPFDELLGSMKSLNRNTYALAARLDAPKP
jgi:hypothetical protein